MRKIIHCDADCFFAALEMRDDPSLRGIPMAVGGDPTKRGVISTCNYEARAFGVRSAMASAHAKRLCPQLIVVPHNRNKYQEASEAMRSIFLDYSDSIEPLSLDEAFIDVTSSYHCLGSATFIAKEIRRRVKEEVGITVSAGVAANKFLAKVASDWQKPDGLTVIEPSQVRFFLKTLPVSCLPGVGKATLSKLTALGLDTCADLQSLSHDELFDKFGKYGLRLYELSRGEDNRPLEQHGARRSLSIEHTLATDLQELKQCYPVLIELQKKLVSRLSQSADKPLVYKSFVKVKFADFRSTSVETLSDSQTFTVFKSLLHTAWQRYQQPIRLIGVGVRFAEKETLSISESQQMNLF